jgi:hypothetical protein
MKLSRNERLETARHPRSHSHLAESKIIDRQVRVRRTAVWTLLCLGLSISTPASASDEAFELWLAPSLRGQLDENTGLRLETAQRFRNSSERRPDTYFVRLWASQQVSPHLTLEGAIERRVNDGGADETRLLQQVVAQHGIFRNRLRLEQRFIDRSAQTGWRLRSEHGVRIDLDRDHKWFVRADAEFFFTLQSNSIGGQTGFTEQRSQAGIGHRFTPHVSASLSYKRVQTIRRGRDDVVGHIPMIHFDYVF